ncbi:MAG: glycosyl transferase [Spirulinaceae cyanobacterium]
MAPPTLYVAITNHGFGHATRAASVAHTVQQLCPEVLLILATTAPRWLLESYIAGDFIHRPRAYDVGVIQADSLQMDQAATLAKLQDIRDRQSQIIASESEFLRTNQVDLVLADIPPLAAPIAQAAGVPCWMMSNFGWDFIYRDWGQPFAEMVAWIEQCFGQCDRLLRLPLHEPMTAFDNITDMGLTGGSPKVAPEALQRQFNLTAAAEQTVLLTFGGLGLDAIPYKTLGSFPDWQFITFDRQAPDLPNLLKITDRHYRPVDFMPLCGRVVSKPGFSTFSEALRLGRPLVSLIREGFAEAPLLLDGLRQYGHHQIIAPEPFFAGDWGFLQETPAPPQGNQPIDRQGTEAIAAAIVEQLIR